LITLKDLPAPANSYLTPQKINFPTSFIRMLEEENQRRLTLLADLTPNHWFHCYDTATHCRIVHKKAIELGQMHKHHVDTNLLQYAAMSHDWGKLEAWRPEGSPWFPGHEKISAQTLVQLSAPDALIRLVANHGRCMQLDQYGTKAIERLLRSIGNASDHMAFFLLLISDCAGFSEAGAKAGLKQAHHFALEADLYTIEPDLRRLVSSRQQAQRENDIHQ
jgi:hypothetical protein